MAMAALEAATTAVNGVATTHRWGWRKGTVKTRGESGSPPSPPPRPYKPDRQPSDLFEKRLHRAQGWQEVEPAAATIERQDRAMPESSEPEPGPGSQVVDPKPDSQRRPRRPRKRTLTATPQPLPQYRSIGTCVVRQGPEIDSAKIGTLQAGEIITALSTKQVSEGTSVQYSGGWVSVRSAKGGKRLLELVTGSIEM